MTYNYQNEDFCRPLGDLNTKTISDEIVCHLGLKKDAAEILTARYNSMQNNFLKTGYKDYPPVCDCKALETKDALLGMPAKCFEEESVLTKLIDKGYKNLGHDMPVWLSPPEPKFRVMILGQDPLRHEDDSDGYLLLSTPWGMHSKDYQPGNVIKKAVKSIVADGGAVYITDLAKIYFQSSEEFPQRIKLFEELFPQIMKDFSSFINREIDLFSPQVIMVIGKDSTKILSSRFPDYKNVDFKKGKFLEEINGRTIVTAYHPNSRESTPASYYSEKISEALNNRCSVPAAEPQGSNTVKVQKLKSKPVTYIVKDENRNELNTFTSKSLEGKVGGWIRDRIRLEDKIDGKKYYIYDGSGQLVLKAQAAKKGNGEFKMLWNV